MDEPSIRSRKAGELESRKLAVRDLVINAVATLVRKRGKLSKPRSPSLGSMPETTISALSSAIVSHIRAKGPLGHPKLLWRDSALRAAATL
jgi:hypothetical protein